MTLLQINGFVVPKRIIFGIGSVSEKLGKEAKTLAREKVLIITDKGVEKSGIVEKVKIAKT